MNEQNLSNRNILITGASSGLGTYITQAFAKAGANLALTYRAHLSDLQNMTDELSQSANQVKVYALDILLQSSIDSLVTQLHNDWEHLDIVILVAGSGGGPSFEALTRKDLDIAVDGSFKGNFMLAKQLGYWMKQTKGLGRIIQITAEAAENTSGSDYGLGKAAQQVAGRFLAYNLAPEVTLNSIAPTAMDENPEHAVAESFNVPLGRMVHAREVSRMCLLLCDSAFDTVTGEVIRMTGGTNVMPPPS